MKPFNNTLFNSLFLDIYSFDNILLCLVFNGFILSVSVMLLCAFLNLYLWLILIRVSVSILFGRDLQMLRWLMFWLLHVFLTCKDNFILIRVWCVTGWPLSTNVFHASICCMHMFGQKQYISESVFFLLYKQYSCWFVHNISLYLMSASVGLASWMTS